ncbi:MAG: shikimate kinase [Syntrophomonadaceae bacterium]|nr:AAA family ATPase [Syntrophomonadaceae bacterium]MDH7497881.1 shikimate kinase [Syntrophomonadaceae bacterium]
MDRNIVLIGFMGSGKSAVGRRLARRLHMEYLDTDSEIEALVGMSVQEIFRRYGEKRFRSEEKALAARLAGRKGLVISSGGGMVLEPENVANLRRNGVLVLLSATPAEVFRRLQRSRTQRPLLGRSFTKEDIARLMAEREPYYACADISVTTTGKALDDVVETILRALKEVDHANPAH